MFGHLAIPHPHTCINFPHKCINFPHKCINFPHKCINYVLPKDTRRERNWLSLCLKRWPVLRNDNGALLAGITQVHVSPWTNVAKGASPLPTWLCGGSLLLTITLHIQTHKQHSLQVETYTHYITVSPLFLLFGADTCHSWHKVYAKIYKACYERTSLEAYY